MQVVIFMCSICQAKWSGWLQWQSPLQELHPTPQLLLPNTSLCQAWCLLCKNWAQQKYVFGSLYVSAESLSCGGGPRACSNQSAAWRQPAVLWLGMHWCNARQWYNTGKEVSKATLTLAIPSCHSQVEESFPLSLRWDPSQYPVQVSGAPEIQLPQKHQSVMLIHQWSPQTSCTLACCHTDTCLSCWHLSVMPFTPSLSTDTTC